MDDLPDALERLTTRLETLERRICVLENSSRGTTSIQVAAAGASQPVQAIEALPFAQAGGVFSVLGKAMLGIAGAYVLRAVAELSSLPKLAVAAIAMVYAIMWLVWATRVRAGEWLASTIYACTSALILAPLLWELTLRFKVLPAAMTAGLLAAFVISASALAWKRDLAPVFWVANVTAAVTALCLSIATHEMAPFIAVLLLMAVICEYAAHRNRELSVRPLVALAADLGVWALVFIYSSPPSFRVDYKVMGTAGLLAPGCILFLTYAASVTLRTVLLQKKITIFEIVQTLMAFLLCAYSLLYFEPESGAILLGVLCLLLSAACYTAAFHLLVRFSEQRNYRVFATWSACLLLAGSWLCLPQFWLPVCLAAGAITATVLGVRMARMTLEIHGLVYLAAAAVTSGLLDYVFHALVWTLPAASGWSVGLVSAGAVVCYAAGMRPRGGGQNQRLIHLLPASLVAGTAAAFLVQGLLWLLTLRMAPEAFHVAFIRTLSACAIALALAYCGLRWQRRELGWVAYAALVFVAAKLLFEDLRQVHLVFIAASIFLYAVTLIAVPRLARLGQSVKDLPLSSSRDRVKTGLPIEESNEADSMPHGNSFTS